MHANQTTSLDKQLEIIRHLVTRVQAPIRTRLVRNLQLTIDLVLIQAYTSSKLGESLVSLVSSLIDNVDIKVLGLLVKQGGGEGPELRGVSPEHRDGGFVDQSRRRVPGLDLLAEDDLEVVGVLLLDDGSDVVVEGVKLLLAEGTDIVKD